MIKVGSNKWLKIGVVVGLLGIVIYPIIIAPMVDPSYYKNIQSRTRAGIDQKEIQPGNMKVWSDPFKK